VSVLGFSLFWQRVSRLAVGEVAAQKKKTAGEGQRTRGVGGRGEVCAPHDISIMAASYSNNRATPPPPSLEVLEGLKTAAEGGDKVSQGALGLYYLQGDGVERNPELGVSWLRKAADQDCGLAHYLLATCYAMGICVAKNVRQARKQYRASAAAGYPAEVS
jgi:hypothetical protein